jgi:hypothetical protein
MTGGFGKAIKRGTGPPKQSLGQGTLESIRMERGNPFDPPDKVFTSLLHLRPEIWGNRLTIRIQK